jgi:hypothetical protein
MADAECFPVTVVVTRIILIIWPSYPALGRVLPRVQRLLCVQWLGCCITHTAPAATVGARGHSSGASSARSRSSACRTRAGQLSWLATVIAASPMSVTTVPVSTWSSLWHAQEFERENADGICYACSGHVVKLCNACSKCVSWELGSFNVVNRLTAAYGAFPRETENRYIYIYDSNRKYR